MNKKLIKSFFPCYSGHKYNHLYCKNATAYENCPTLNSSTQTCEWIQSIYKFLKYVNESTGKEYTLIQCLDIENRIAKSPEVEAVNVHDHTDRIVIEVKTLHELNNVKKQNEVTFSEIWNSLEFEYYNLMIELKKSKIPAEIIELFTKPIFIRCVDDVRWKKATKDKIINDISQELRSYIMNNLKSFIDNNNFYSKDSSYISKKSFEVSGNKFEIGLLSNKCAAEQNVDSLVFAGPMKSVGIDYFNSDMSSKLQSFIDDCELKFKEYKDDYKRILVIKNESNYFEGNIKGRLDELNVYNSNVIDEIWLGYHVYEIVDEYMNEEEVSYAYKHLLP